MNSQRPLDQLADLYGLHTSYQDMHGQTQHASDEALVKMLQCLGAPIDDRPEGASDTLVSATLEHWRQRCEPVMTACADRPPEIGVRVPRHLAERRFHLFVQLEDGGATNLEGVLSDGPTTRAHEVAGESFVEKTLRLDTPIPVGYHAGRLDLDGESSSFRLITAPEKAWSPPKPAWGVFAPVHALRGTSDRGCGHLGDFESLIDWAGALGAAAFGTLPLLPTFLDQPFDPSPYAPVSRLFWNELYLDVERLPELANSPAAQKRLDRFHPVQDVDVPSDGPLVDYQRTMTLKREVLGELSKSFFERETTERSDFEAFAKDHPSLLDYAQFRAATELAAKPWQAWPPVARSGSLGTSDFRPPDVQYHRYVQWRSFQQMASLGRKARRFGIGMYLDFPLGVHGAGYDVWRERETFLRGCSLGAPPDIVFTEGQHWGITPLHPIQLRRQRYRYFIDAVRHHMACAGALRIDHVMGLHRVFCIPTGMPPQEGVYLRFHPDEMYAVLAIESTRASALVVGEDLGIVPDVVRQTMNRTGISRMHVLEYELEGTPHDPFAGATADVVASINTHDLPPFAGWWRGLDIDDRVERNVMTPTEADDARAHRGAMREALRTSLGCRDPGTIDDQELFEVLELILARYAAGPSKVVMVNLEDLWLEREPQNVPGTCSQRPNWRRRFRRSLEQMTQMPQATRLLQRIDHERQGVT